MGRSLGLQIQTPSEVVPSVQVVSSYPSAAGVVVAPAGRAPRWPAQGRTPHRKDACFLLPGTQQAGQPGSSIKPSSHFVRDQDQ